jgi:protein SCO1/2
VSIDGHDLWREEVAARRSLAFVPEHPELTPYATIGDTALLVAGRRGVDPLEAVDALHRRFGTQRFNVVSIGFNQPADSPQAMKVFAAQQGIAAPDWEFLSPHPKIVDALAENFGFRYRATPAGFDHVLQLSVVDAEGRLVRQFYGDRPPADELAELLQQLFSGAPPAEPTALAAFIDRVRILCTVYDPETGRARVDYSLAFEIAGGITFVLAMALYALNEWLVRRRAARLTQRKTAPAAPRQTASS